MSAHVVAHVIARVSIDRFNVFLVHDTVYPSLVVGTPAEAVKGPEEPADQRLGRMLSGPYTRPRRVGKRIMRRYYHGHFELL